MSRSTWELNTVSISLFRLRVYHSLWITFPGNSTIKNTKTDRSVQRSNLAPQPPRNNAYRLSHCGNLGCFHFARHYSGNRFLFLFLKVLRCFTSPGFASLPYVFRQRYCSITHSRLPHSEISGSKPVCGSPKLIAAYHVLHRLLVPSHPS